VGQIHLRWRQRREHAIYYIGALKEGWGKSNIAKLYTRTETAQKWIPLAKKRGWQDRAFEVCRGRKRLMRRRAGTAGRARWTVGYDGTEKSGRGKVYL